MRWSDYVKWQKSRRRNLLTWGNVWGVAWTIRQRASVCFILLCQSLLVGLGISSIPKNGTTAVKIAQKAKTTKMTKFSKMAAYSNQSTFTVFICPTSQVPPQLKEVHLLPVRQDSKKFRKKRKRQWQRFHSCSTHLKASWRSNTWWKALLLRILIVWLI